MPPKVIRFSIFEVDLEQRELRKSGARVPLQHKPFRILELLLQQPGSLVKRRDLAKELWPGLHVNFEHGLNSAMNTLRQVLGDSPRESRFIETRSGLGYRFIAPIENHSSTSSAHQDCLRGRFFLNKLTSAGIQRAIGCFQSALNEDPCSVAARTGLADAYLELALSGTVDPSELRPMAAKQVADALLQEPNYPRAHVSLGRLRMIFEWDWLGASQAFQKAIDLDPDLSDAYVARALMLAALNRHAEALCDIRQAQTLDPLSLPVGYHLARLLFLSKRFPEAVVQSWAVLSLEPGFAPAQEVLGLAYAEQGSYDEAITECENACECSDRHPSALASLAYVYEEKTSEILGQLQEFSSRQYVSPYFVAIVQLALRNDQRALQSLQTACLRGDPLLLWLNADPRFAALRSQPDFLALTHRVRGSVSASV